jgi:predicted transcriptional regulator
MPISINLDSDLTFKLDEAAAKEQVSRVTLLLPAPKPKFSFREWLFGQGKKKDNERDQMQSS